MTCLKCVWLLCATIAEFVCWWKGYHAHSAGQMTEAIYYLLWAVIWSLSSIASIMKKDLWYEQARTEA